VPVGCIPLKIIFFSCVSMVIYPFKSRFISQTSRG
jgi:hypothetical protein